MEERGGRTRYTPEGGGVYDYDDATAAANGPVQLLSRPRDLFRWVNFTPQRADSASEQGVHVILLGGFHI